MDDPDVLALEDEFVIERAADAGFRLVQYETDTGQLVWEWRRRNEPRSHFVTRRVAIHWIRELLAQEHGVAFVSNTGQPYWLGTRGTQHEGREP